MASLPAIAGNGGEAKILFVMTCPIRVPIMESSCVPAGTIYGGEGIVAELAQKMGFELIGAPVSDRIKSEIFSSYVKKFVITGKTWGTRNMFFTNMIDGLIVAGKSITLTEHLKSSIEAGKPAYNVKGFNSAMDVYANNLKSGINFSDGNIDRVISEMEKAHGQPLRKFEPKGLLLR